MTQIEDEDLTHKLCSGLEQVKMIQEGNLPRRTIQDMLDEISGGSLQPYAPLMNRD